jgi:outer membrane protein
MTVGTNIYFGEIKLKTALTKTLAVLALGWCVWAPVQAQTSASRIAWLSPERIYNESRLAKLAGEKLAEEFKSREKAMADMAARLKTASEKLDKDAPSLAEPDRVKRQRDVFELDKEYQRRQREFREDLNQRTNEERQAISEKATKIIKQLALVEGFDIVLQDAVWASPRIDITDKVLAALDKDK